MDNPHYNRHCLADMHTTINRGLSIVKMQYWPHQPLPSSVTTATRIKDCVLTYKDARLQTMAPKVCNNNKDLSEPSIVMLINYYHDRNDLNVPKLPWLVDTDVNLSLSLHGLRSHEETVGEIAPRYFSMNGRTYFPSSCQPFVSSWTWNVVWRRSTAPSRQF